MPQEKVTRKELEGMAIGQTTKFYLTSKNKLQATASTLTQLKNEDRGEWKHEKNYDECSITITRIA